ncbi:MAG: phage tail assembly chaperone [Pseudomonadota bacterium]
MTSRRPEPFPWAEAMHFGFSHLKLGPTQFWAMTPIELAAAMRGADQRKVPAETIDTLRSLIDAASD